MDIKPYTRLKNKICIESNAITTSSIPQKIGKHMRRFGKSTHTLTEYKNDVCILTERIMDSKSGFVSRNNLNLKRCHITS